MPNRKSSHFTSAPLLRTLIASAALVAVRALAQDVNGNATPVANASLDTVTVTGQRASNRASVNAKRSEDRVMDAIAADETRQLPDRSVAETVRRIPGVSVTFNADNQNGRDEAQRPVIRGLDARYNNSTIDGLPISSADANNTVTGFAATGIRGARLDLLPSTMIKQLEVFKSWTPDMDPNAIGGSINVVTPSAFDNGGRTSLSLTGALGHTSNHGSPYTDQALPKRFDLGFSKTFGKGRNVGLVLGLDYQQIDTATQGHMTTDAGYYNYFDPASGRAVTPTAATVAGLIPIPQQNKFFYFQNSRERQGLTAKVEALPTRDVYTFVTLGNFRTGDEQTRTENFYAYNTNQVTNVSSTGADIAAARYEVGHEQKNTRRTTQLFQAGLDWDLAADQRLSARFSVSKARHRETVPSMTKFENTTINYTGTVSGGPYAGQILPFPAVQNDRTDLAGHIDTSRFEPSFTYKSAAGLTSLNDPSNYRTFYWRYYDRSAENLTRDLRLDYKRNLEPGSTGLGFGVGLDYMPTTYSFDYNITQWLLNGAAMTPAQLASFNMAGIGGLSNIAVPNAGGASLILMDIGKAQQQYDSNKALFRLDAQTLKNSLQDDFTHAETTTAGYLMAGYNSADIRSLFGVRIEDTRQTSTGWQKNATAATPAYVAPDVLTTSSSSYRSVLPSASASYKLSEEVKMKGAVSKTLGRPDYSFYAPIASVTQGLNSVTISTGNPAIKPRRSTNIDFSAEYYGNSVMLAAGLFHKTIKDEIFVPTNTVQTVAANGVTQTTTTSMPTNAPGAKMTGLELSAVVDSLRRLHPALVNIGVSANVAIIKSKMQVPLNGGATREIDRIFGQPDRLANLTAFYSGPQVGLRVSYNMTGKSLRALEPQNPWNDVYWKSRSQVDLSANYKFDTSWTGFVQLANLGADSVSSVTGPNKNLLKDTYAVGRTLWVGVTFAPRLAN